MKTTPITFKTLFTLVFIPFASITYIEAQEVKQIAHVKDISTSVISSDNFNPDEIIQKTIDREDLISNGIGIDMYTVCIGQDAYPKFSKTKLTPVNYWLTSKKVRQANLDAFKADTKSVLDSVDLLESTNQYSSLYRGVIHIIEQMDSNSEKVLYIYSDGAECSLIANFYNVKDWNKEYETLKQALLSDTRVPEVRNMTIVFITNGRDELTVKAIRFWKRFYSELRLPIKVLARASL